MGVRKHGDSKPPEDELLPEAPRPAGARPAAPATLAFSELDELPTSVSEETVRVPGENPWAGQDGGNPDIGPPLFMDDIPEPTVGDASHGSPPVLPEADPWKGFSVQKAPRVSPPTIIPDPDGSDDQDFVPEPLPTVAPSGALSGVEAGREPEQRRRNRDATRPPPADLATLLARSGVVPRAKARGESEVQEVEPMPADESGGTGYRWAIVVIVLAVAAAVAGTAITLMWRGGALPAAVVAPVADGAVEAATPSAEDDPTAGRTPPQGRSFVRFVSTPEGAVVRVDGDFVGRTPTTADLALGSHEILMTLEGHAGFSKTIDVNEPRKRVEASLGDGPIRGPANIVAPGMEGARLWIDGRPHGTIPAEVVLSPGLHKFKVSGPAGTLEVEREVWVLDGATVQIDLGSK